MTKRDDSHLIDTISSVDAACQVRRMINALVRKGQQVESCRPGAGRTGNAPHISMPKGLIEYAEARMCGLEPRGIAVVLRKQPDVLMLRAVEAQHYSTAATST